jgi:hypothetical protein
MIRFRLDFIRTQNIQKNVFASSEKIPEHTLPGSFKVSKIEVL